MVGAVGQAGHAGVDQRQGQRVVDRAEVDRHVADPVDRAQEAHQLDLGLPRRRHQDLGTQLPGRPVLPPAVDRVGGGGLDLAGLVPPQDLGGVAPGLLVAVGHGWTPAWTRQRSASQHDVAGGGPPDPVVEGVDLLGEGLVVDQLDPAAGGSSHRAAPASTRRATASVAGP